MRMKNLLNKFKIKSYITFSSVVIIIIGFISVLIISFWNNNTSTEKVKKIYFVDNISRPQRHVIEKFNEINKGKIKVEAINLPFEKFSTNERKELLARYLRSKNDKIDIFSADQIWGQRFARWAEPLDKYFSAADKKQILNYALKSCLYKNKMVAVPSFMDVSLMYYRKDILDKLPNHEEIERELQGSITWSNFIKLGREFESRTNKPFYIFQADNYEGLMCSFMELLEEQNKTLYENDTLQLTSPESIRALTLLVDLVNKYRISPSKVTGFKEDNSYRYFILHNGLFVRAWANFPRDYTSIYGKEPKINNLVKVPVPHLDGFQQVSLTGGWNLMISKYSQRKAEAIKFIKFLMSEEAQKIMYEEGGYLPTNNKIYSDSIYLSKHPDLKFFKNYMKYGIHRPYLVDYTRISDIVTHYIRMAIKKEISVKKALQEATKTINN